MNPQDYARLRQLFLAASQLTPVEREAYLRRECEGSSELYREVVELLDHHATGTLLEAQAVATVATPRGRSTGPLLGQLQTAWSQFGTARWSPLGSLSIALLVALLLGALTAPWVYFTLREQLQATQRESLIVLRDAQVSNLRATLRTEIAQVQAWSRSPELVAGVEGLLKVDLNRPDSLQQLKQHADAARVRRVLQAAFGPQVLYAVWNRSGIKLADQTDDGHSLGNGVTELGGALLARVFANEPVIRLPHNTETITIGYIPDTSRPNMGVLVPVTDGGNRVIAALLIRGIGTEQRFFAALTQTRPGQTGEMYAFSKEGLLISPSRFEKELVAAGLISPKQDAWGVLQLQIRDPGQVIGPNFHSTDPPESWPLTKAARFAVLGEPGVDVAGYRDYRGRNVVGAWDWLHEYGFGVVLEVNADEVLRPLRVLNITTLVSGLILGVSLLAVALTLLLQRQSAQLLHPKGQRVGSYVLEELIGEGGMGQVYRARHALLKRPTAVKLLKKDLTDPDMITRFEREVKIACRLCHPHTIEIYDYGRTDQGLFYYAMEYLRGVSLERLVRQYGPVSAPRTVALLKQICASLREAHEYKVVHRDIKPQNIMLCCLGGEPDQIKVLDFGLVKPINHDPQAGQTEVTLLVGTPRYIAPERVLQPRLADPRSDLYSVGAVAYFLLTGHEIFDAAADQPLIHHILLTTPTAISQFVEVPHELEALVMRCLLKSPDERPASAAEILEELEGFTFGDRWTTFDARVWWERHLPEYLSGSTESVDRLAHTPTDVNTAG